MKTSASRLVGILAFSWLVLASGLSLTLLGALTQTTDNTTAAYFRRAANLDQQGKLDEAEREYLLGLKVAPDTPDARNNLGVIYFKRKKFGQAVEAFQHAHGLQPDNPEFSFNLGLALFQEGHSAAAIPHLTAGAAAPDHVTDAHFLRSLLLRPETVHPATRRPAANPDGF